MPHPECFAELLLLLLLAPPTPAPAVLVTVVVATAPRLDSPDGLSAQALQ